MKRFVSLQIFFALHLTLLCAAPKKNTFIITLNSPQKAETIYLLRPLDYVSYHCDTVASARMNASGRYELSALFEPGERVLFQAQYQGYPPQVWAAYAEPGGTCTLTLRDGIIDPVVISPQDGYNSRISRMAESCKSIRRRYESKWDTIFMVLGQMKLEWKDEPDPFLNTFAEYHITYNQVEAATHLLRYDIADSLGKWLVIDRPMMYNHPEYMQFVNLMALNSMMNSSMRHKCNTPADEKQDHDPIYLLLCDSHYYPTLQLRELVLLMGFKLSFQHAFYREKTAFITSFNSFLAVVSDPANRQIGENIRKRYCW